MGEGLGGQPEYHPQGSNGTQHQERSGYGYQVHQWRLNNIAFHRVRNNYHYNNNYDGYNNHFNNLNNYQGGYNKKNFIGGNNNN